MAIIGGAGLTALMGLVSDRADYLSALGREQFGGGAADTLASTGHDRPLARQTVHPLRSVSGRVRSTCCSTARVMSMRAICWRRRMRAIAERSNRGRVEQVERLGRAALKARQSLGIAIDGDYLLLATKDAGYRLSFDLNVHAITHMLQAFLPAMIAQGVTANALADIIERDRTGDPGHRALGRAIGIAVADPDEVMSMRAICWRRRMRAIACPSI
jgi:hypothetical protein